MALFQLPVNHQLRDSMKAMITPVKFPNRNGCELFGILHEPEECCHDSAIILLSPGIKSRVAPHRLYVKMAGLFCSMGFMVLRMDPAGLGDSEGEIIESLSVDVYGSIEIGRLVNDTIDALDWMEATRGTGSFILSGLCGGAITALLTAEKDVRVHAILSLGMPCVLASNAINPAKYIPSKQLDSIRKKYLAKVLDSQAWKRFLSFKSDYKLIIQSLLHSFKRKSKGKKPPLQNDSQNQPHVARIDSNLNPHFPRAFSQFVSKNKILLVFSEADRLFWEFEEKYLNIFHPQVAPFAGNFRIEIIKEANHVFSFAEWQKKMLFVSKNWLIEIGLK